jgi:hypothetical protein
MENVVIFYLEYFTAIWYIATLLKNRLTFPTLFPDTGGAWCVQIKLACWRTLFF